VSGPVTSVARVDDVQIFLKDPVLLCIHCCQLSLNDKSRKIFHCSRPQSLD